MSMPLSKIDQLIVGIDSILRGFTNNIKGTARANPASTIPSPDLTTAERRHSAGLMRVNYTGEVAAQALYLGQALVARNDVNRQNLMHAAKEEEDHLLWCGQRLNDLQARPSYLNPLWFIGSLAIGVTAGLVNDAYSLGFVVETERQVEAHLASHLQQLPVTDVASQAILEQMRLDEQQHGNNALLQGAQELPDVVKLMMRVPAKIMTSVAYYF
jgi:ubiquinone biosynthesis monooxygenase Coq7